MLITETGTGTSSRRSERFWAVTTTLASSDELFALSSAAAENAAASDAKKVAMAARRGRRLVGVFGRILSHSGFSCVCARSHRRNREHAFVRETA